MMGQGPHLAGMTDDDFGEEDSTLAGRVKRYAKVGTSVGGLAAQLAGARVLGRSLDRVQHSAELKQALGGLKGPLMKAAQILATIPDALPREYAGELRQLQSNAPAMGWPFVRRRMRAELGPDWQKRFQEFEHHAAAAASLRHFRAADRWVLVPVREVELGLAWAYLLHDEVEPAVTRIRTILARDPDNDPLRDDLFRVLLSRGRADEALAVRLEAFDRHPAPPAERMALATRLAQSGHSEAACPLVQIRKFLRQKIFSKSGLDI